MAENTNIDSIEFRPADNGGAISRTRLQDSPSGMYRPPKESIHPTLEHATAHMKKVMKNAFGKSSSGKSDSKKIEGLTRDTTKKFDKKARMGKI